MRIQLFFLVKTIILDAPHFMTDWVFTRALIHICQLRDICAQLIVDLIANDGVIFPKLGYFEVFLCELIIASVWVIFCAFSAINLNIFDTLEQVGW